MISELVVDVQPKEVSIAVLEDKNLVELQKEARNVSFAVGDIYLGKVKKLMPGLNAAFIDVGYKKDAFLHYLDLGPNFNTQQKFLKQALGEQKGDKKIPTISKMQLLPEIEKDGSISNVLKVGQEVLVQIAKEPISMETPIGDDEDSHLGDFLEDTETEAPAEAAQNENLEEAIKQVLDSLTPREAKVLRMRFGIEMSSDHTLEEVGKQFDVTRERIRQIEAKALRKLRHPSRSDKLKSFIDGEDKK